MNKKFFLIGFFLIGFFFISINSVSATCQDPTVTYSFNKEHETENGRGTMSLTVTSGTLPLIGCACPVGQNCDWRFQYGERNLGGFNLISQSTNPNRDFNCGGVPCNNILEDQDGSDSRIVWCTDFGQGAYYFRARRPWKNLLTQNVFFNCYPKSPIDTVLNAGKCEINNGNIDINTTCNYIDVPLWINDGNFNIQDNGYVILNSSDINYTGGTGKVTIESGGRLDLNNSNWFTIEATKDLSNWFFPISIALLFSSFLLISLAGSKAFSYTHNEQADRLT